MTDEQFAALTTKLDEILSRLQVVEEHSAIINVETLARSPDEMKKLTDMIEVEIGRRVRTSVPFHLRTGGVF